MINSNSNMVSPNNHFTVVIPLDTVYQNHPPNYRQMIDIWLNDLVSPFSLALVFLDLNIKNHHHDNSAKLWTTLEFLSNEAERRLVHAYVLSLIEELTIYLLPMLVREDIQLDDISLVSAVENIIDEWSCGNVTLTFNLHRQRRPNPIVGTSFINQQYNPPTIPYTNSYQVFT